MEIVKITEIANYLILQESKDRLIGTRSHYKVLGDKINVLLTNYKKKSSNFKGAYVDVARCIDVCDALRQGLSKWQHLSLIVDEARLQEMTLAKVFDLANGEPAKKQTKNIKKASVKIPPKKNVVTGYGKKADAVANFALEGIEEMNKNFGEGGVFSDGASNTLNGESIVANGDLQGKKLILEEAAKNGNSWSSSAMDYSNSLKGAGRMRGSVSGDAKRLVDTIETEKKRVSSEMFKELDEDGVIGDNVGETVVFNPLEKLSSEELDECLCSLDIEDEESDRDIVEVLMKVAGTTIICGLMFQYVRVYSSHTIEGWKFVSWLELLRWKYLVAWQFSFVEMLCFFMVLKGNKSIGIIFAVASAFIALDMFGVFDEFGKWGEYVVEFVLSVQMVAGFYYLAEYFAEKHQDHV